MQYNLDLCNCKAMMSACHLLLLYKKLQYPVGDPLLICIVLALPDLYAQMHCMGNIIEHIDNCNLTYDVAAHLK